MSQGLWVEHKTETKTYLDWVPIKDYKFVAQFIREIKEDTQLAIPKNTEITLHEPSGTAISVGDPISSLVPGNSFTNPLHVQVSALPPVTAKPASNAGLTKFWNSLRGMKPENGFLHFLVRPSFFPALLKSLYIRKVYEDLFEIIWKNQDKENDEKLIRMAITGTPGIGKSIFLFYILWKLANMETRRTVILHRNMERGCIYVFQDSGCWETFNYAEIASFLKDVNTWYLTDTLDPPPALVEAVTILVSSPARRHYSTFLKLLPMPPLHYLPLWSLDELKLVASSYGRKPEIVEERFKKIGGIARFVLEEDGELDKTIKGRLEY